MMRLSAFLTGSFASGPDQPRRLGEVDAVQRGFQRRLAHHRVVDGGGPDLDSPVAVVAHLGQERETEDGHPRVPVEAAAVRTLRARPVLGVDRRTEIGADNPDDERGDGRGEPDQQFAHRHIVAHSHRIEALGAADQQVRRYR